MVISSFTFTFSVSLGVPSIPNDFCGRSVGVLYVVCQIIVGHVAFFILHTCSL